MKVKQPNKWDGEGAARARGIAVGDATHKSASRDLSDADWDKLARRPRRWPKRLAVFLILVAVVVAALPTVVSKVPLLRNAILSAVLPRVVPNGCVQVAIGDLSLGWRSAPAVSGIEVRDGAGQPLLAVESMHLSRSPWALVTNWHELGEIEITRPVVYVAVRPDGSNVEDVIKQFASKASASSDGDGGVSAAKVAVAVKVVDGSVLVQETATGRGWRLASLNAQYDSHGAGLGQMAATGIALAEPVAPVNGGGASVAPPMPAGKFAVSLATDANGREQAQWQADAITLNLAEPWLKRFVAGMELNGALSGQGTAAWSIGQGAAGNQGAKPQAALPADLVTAGSLRIDRLDVGAPALRGDRVRLVAVELPWRLTSQANGLAIEDLQFKSDVGQLAARGVIDSSLLAAQSAPGVAAIDAAAQQNLEVRGELDLAKLAAMLPHALAIREGTTINSGTIQLAIRNQPVDGGQTLSGQIRTEKLSGTSGGTPLAWDQPVNATFELRREKGSLRLNSLTCDSDFLKVNAAGTLQQITASAEFDLNKLSSQLGQFVDLSGMQLAGTGTAHLDCHLADANQFTVAANSELLQLRIAMGGDAPISEPRLALKAEAVGLFDAVNHRSARVATARLQIDADNDQLDAQLAEPVDCAAAAPSWPLSIRVSGSIAHWLALAHPWMATNPWQVDGQSQLTADVRAGSAAVDVSNAKATITNLHVVGVGWNINEPRVELAADLHLNLLNNEIASQSAQVVSSTVALATKDVHVLTSGNGPPQVTGVAAFRTDVARLASWQVPPTQPAPYQPQGTITGNVRVVQQADQITGEMNVTGQNLVLAQWMAAGGAGQAARAAGYQTIWQEPQVTIAGTTTYDGAADKLAFQQLQVQSNTLQMAASGQVDKLKTTADVNAAGTLNYDLAQITQLLKPFFGDGIQLGGRETARFQVAGPLGGAPGVAAQSVSFAGAAANPLSAMHWSRRLQARMEVPWASANVYGLPVGGGKIAAALGDGTLRVDPLTLAVADGQLTAAPNVQLDPGPMLLTLPKGPVLANVKISQEVSEAMLKYIAPVLAGATQSEGQFSLQVDGARVPLLNTKKTDAAGQLTVHSVRVVPGPMAKQWVDLGQQIQSLVKRGGSAADPNRQVSLLTVQDQQVNFRVADGRVYHQGMEFQIGDMTCHSDGSVGLDETVAITLRIAIPDKWVEGQPLLAGFKGQQLTIPIGGTLQRPQMDQRAVASLSKQLLQGAAQQAVGGELNKALDKFFKAN